MQIKKKKAKPFAYLIFYLDLTKDCTKKSPRTNEEFSKVILQNQHRKLVALLYINNGIAKKEVNNIK
jgi:hypothetical protein